MGQKLDVTNVPVGKAHEEFPGGLVGSGVAVSCGVGRRRGSDLALLWLWRRLGVRLEL